MHFANVHNDVTQFTFRFSLSNLCVGLLSNSDGVPCLLLLLGNLVQETFAGDG